MLHTLADAVAESYSDISGTKEQAERGWYKFRNLYVRSEGSETLGVRLQWLVYLIIRMIHFLTFLQPTVDCLDSVDITSFGNPP